MRKQFWEIVKDIDRELFEICGISEDDTFLTNTIAEMQEYSLSVQCETTAINIEKSSLISSFEHRGYRYKAGLFEELRSELATRKSGFRKN